MLEEYGNVWGRVQTTLVKTRMGGGEGYSPHSEYILVMADMVLAHFVLG